VTFSVGTTEFMRELRERLNEFNPKPILSANGGSSWRGDRALEEARSRQVGGILFFSAKTLTDDYLDALKTGTFRTPAVFPFKRS
jgi:hypothetical protein